VKWDKLTDIVAVQEGVSGENIRVVVTPSKTNGLAGIIGFAVVGRLAGYISLYDGSSEGDISEGEDGNECEGHCEAKCGQTGK
jgi:hypothetical protein